MLSVARFSPLVHSKVFNQIASEKGFDNLGEVNTGVSNEAVYNPRATNGISTTLSICSSIGVFLV